jgi:hypothetical protein
MARALVVGAVVALVGFAALAYVEYEGGFGCGCPPLRNNTRMVMHTVEEAVVHYQTDHSDACPTSIQALVDGRYLTRLPHDKWGQPLAFRCPGPHAPDGAEITSAGPDRRFGTADDLHSWD